MRVWARVRRVGEALACQLFITGQCLNHNIEEEECYFDLGSAHRLHRLGLEMHRNWFSSFFFFLIRDRRRGVSQ